MVAASATSDRVRFGSTAALEMPGPRRLAYQIVGKDIARLLMGATVGDVVALADGEAKILEIR